MPIVISICPRCAESIEIDTERAVVLTGTAESVWRVLRERYGDGDVINLQLVADFTFMHRASVLRTLRQLSDKSLVTCELKRPGGRYHRWIMASKHPAKITRAIATPLGNVA